MAIAAPLKRKNSSKTRHHGVSDFDYYRNLPYAQRFASGCDSGHVPILERSMSLTFTQLGIIAFTLNMVSSVMQPVVGWYTDKRPRPYALPVGLTASMLGILGLAFAPSFITILCCVFSLD